MQDDALIVAHQQVLVVMAYFVVQQICATVRLAFIQQKPSLHAF